MIGQAIFTSTRGPQLDGYQLVTVSPNVCEEDRRALTQWGAAHGSLQDDGPHARSINFHPLPSGATCVSRTWHAGAEYSHRSGLRVHSLALIVPPETLVRFAGQPFRILEAALVAGHVPADDRLPATLPPFALPGRASLLPGDRLSRLAQHPGFAPLARLLDPLLQEPAVAVVTSLCGERLLDGLFDLLPPQRRGEFSFSTGLRPSPSRPFRLIVLRPDAKEDRRALERNRVRIVPVEAEDYASGEPAWQPQHCWTQLVWKFLETGRLLPLGAMVRKAGLLPAQPWDELTARLSFPTAPLPPRLSSAGETAETGNGCHAGPLTLPGGTGR